MAPQLFSSRYDSHSLAHHFVFKTNADHLLDLATTISDRSFHHLWWKLSWTKLSLEGANLIRTFHSWHKLLLPLRVDYLPLPGILLESYRSRPLALTVSCLWPNNIMSLTVLCLHLQWISDPITSIHSVIQSVTCLFVYFASLFCPRVSCYDLCSLLVSFRTAVMVASPSFKTLVSLLRVAKTGLSRESIAFENQWSAAVHWHAKQDCYVPQKHTRLLGLDLGSQMSDDLPLHFTLILTVLIIVISVAIGVSTSGQCQHNWCGCKQEVSVGVYSQRGSQA